MRLHLNRSDSSLVTNWFTRRGSCGDLVVGQRIFTVMASTQKANYSVLVVDDSDDDGTLLELAFQKLDRFHLLGRAGDGVQAIAYLKGEGKYSNRHRHPFPDVL